MEVILLESIRKLGKLGDKVKVRGGFGRNFLIPQGKALPANAANIAEFEARKAEYESQMEKKLQEAQNRKVQLEEKVVTVPAKAGDEGRLFGSVGTRDIAEAITAMGIAVNKSEVRLPNGVIRQTGDFEIDLQLHSEVFATVKVSVIAE